MSERKSEILLELEENYWLQQIYELNREMLEELRRIRRLLEHQQPHTYPRTSAVSVTDLSLGSV